LLLGAGMMLMGEKPFQMSLKLWLRAGAALLLAAAGLNAAGAANPPSRPILFVHGFCGADTDFAPLIEPLYSQLNKDLYPTRTLYYVRYSSRTNETTFYSSSGPVDENAIPSDTRFFSIEFYDPVGDKTDPTDVAKISVLNKAYEISQAVAHITAITHVKDVIVVAHSLGGLDARAYVENMASADACYDYQANMPNYSLHTCLPGAGDARFWGDVGDVITLDTPNAGTPLDTFNLTEYASIVGTCIADPSVTRAEMNPKRSGGPGLLEALNYSGATLGDARPRKNAAAIQAVEDYFSDVPNAWTEELDPNFTGYSDDIVQLTSQSITKHLPAVQSTAKLADVPVSYLSTDTGIASTSACWIDVPYIGPEPVLHFMACLGAQPATQNAIAKQVAAHTQSTLTSIRIDATLDGKPWPGSVRYRLSGPEGATAYAGVPVTLDDLALGAYSVAYVSGGPKAVRAPSIVATPTDKLQRGQWAATFTLGFSSKNPSAVTSAASAITGDGATLHGTVNPEGQAGQPFFEWSTKSNMGSPTIACKAGELKNCPAVKANYAAQAISVTVTTAPKDTTIYFRAVFYDTASKTHIYGAILSFKTGKG
jgi:triacylglycerol esterase/lipase EstA (alpha/beta hydrolase family)